MSGLLSIGIALGFLMRYVTLSLLKGLRNDSSPKFKILKPKPRRKFSIAHGCRRYTYTLEVSFAYFGQALVLFLIDRLESAGQALPRQPKLNQANPNQADPIKTSPNQSNNITPDPTPGAGGGARPPRNPPRKPLRGYALGRGRPNIFRPEIFRSKFFRPKNFRPKKFSAEQIFGR